jgi:16S rRNA (guanine527-N7)-methyltransferase
MGNLARYYDLLQHWNQRINLTALPLEDYPSSTLDRLLVEPLLAASRAVPATCRGPWIDVGSGGGSPGLPMKLVRPDLELTLTESRGRKAAFLREAIRQLGLAHAEVFEGRFETLQARRASISLVTVRAVRIDQALTEASAHLLCPGGRLILFGTHLPTPPPGFLTSEETTVFQVLERTEAL